MNVVQSLVAAVALTAASLGSAAVFAQPAMDTVKAAPKDMTDGEIRKVDKVGGKVTIKHGPIKNLGMSGMSGMTMAFAVKNKALLDQVKAGDKIKFNVVMENSNMVVTDIQKVN